MKEILQVNMESDLVVMLKNMFENVALNVRCAFAPPTGFEEQEMESFWQKPRGILVGIPGTEKYSWVEI